MRTPKIPDFALRLHALPKRILPVICFSTGGKLLLSR